MSDTRRVRHRQDGRLGHKVCGTATVLSNDHPSQEPSKQRTMFFNSYRAVWWSNSWVANMFTA